MRIRIIINEVYGGIKDGGSLRYVNLVRELARMHQIRVYMPAGATQLKADIPSHIDVITGEASTRIIPGKKGVFAFFTSLLIPTKRNIVLWGFNYYPEVDILLAKDSHEYDGEIYFDISTFINYGQHRKSAKVLCDLCDSRLRALSTNKIYIKSISKYCENYFLSKYIRRIKRRFLHPDITISAITEEDCNYIKSVLPRNNIVCIPNGVATDVHAEESDIINRKWNEKYIIFVGTLNFPPNVDALKRLFTNIWPIIKKARPSVKLMIVGRNPAQDIISLADNTDGVSLRANVESVFPYLRESYIAINPVFLGAGMKNKVLEALACGTPVIATEEAVVGISMKNGVHGFLENSETAIAQRAIEMLDMPIVKYEEFCRNARDLGLSYSWAASAKKITNYLEDMNCISYDADHFLKYDCKTS